MVDIKTANFINKSNEVHHDSYDYSKTKYINMRTKVEVICPSHKSFLVTPASHLYLESGCPQCGLIKRKPKPRKTTEKFAEEATAVHGGKYDYSKTKYTKSSDKVLITCKQHGDFTSIAHNHLRGSGCASCAESKGETFLAELLSNYGIEFKREHRLEKSTYRYDFYLPVQNILIEFHGIQHYEVVDYWGGEDGLKDRQRRDAEKVHLAKEYGIPLITLNVYHLNSKVLEQALQRDLKSIYKHWYKFENKLLHFKCTRDATEYFNLPATPLGNYFDRLIQTKVKGLELLFETK